MTVNSEENTDYSTDAALSVSGLVGTNTRPIMATEGFLFAGRTSWCLYYGWQS